MPGEWSSHIVASTVRSVGQGCDVLLRGERGSGRSTLLTAVQSALSSAGPVGLTVRAAGGRELSALTLHPSSRGQVHDIASGVQWLSRELRSQESLLLADDLDGIDPVSLEVIRDVLRAVPSRLVATISTDPLRRQPAPLAEILMDRTPVQVRVAPWDLASVSAVLAEVLGGPAGAGLASAVASETGGHPRAVTTLVRAARAAGAVREVDGVWVGEVDAMPLDALALAYLPSLDEEELAAVQLLACAGPMPSDRAQGMVDSAVLDALLDSGRLVCHHLPGAEPMLAVAPPALARAVREQIGPHQHRQIVRRTCAQPAGTDGCEPVRPAHDPAPARSTRVTQPRRATVPIQERVDLIEADRRTAWLADRSVWRANAYLRVLLSRPQPDLVDAVFTQTRFDDCREDDDRVLFADYEARWAAWTGIPDDEVRARVTARVGDRLPLLADQVAVTRDLVRRVRDGDVRAEALLVRADRVDAPVRAQAIMAEADSIAFLEAGMPARALACARAGEALADGLEPEHVLGALASESLLLLGELEPAEQRERAHLQRAHDRADLVGIGVHACVLAEVLLFAGRPDEAWDVLSASLRLGAGGPLDSPYSRRGLVIGAVLQRQGGDHASARALLRDLARMPQASRAPLESVEVVARLAVELVARGHDRKSGAAWDLGACFAADGLVLPAMLAWMSVPGVLTADQAITVREACAGVSVPLLDPYLRVHLALADGDEQAATDALPLVSASVAPLLARVVGRLGPGTARDLERGRGPGAIAPADRRGVPKQRGAS